MRLAAALIAALLAAPGGAAFADERITNFDSRVVVAPAGDLTVTETIDVHAEGREIRHGVFRDFPTTRRSRNGGSFRVGFEVVSVSRDGQPEPYSLTGIEDGQRVLLGSPDVEIFARPAHRYVLTYRTDRQVNFLPDRDELAWNATGNFWRFPIDRAQATIVLPESARIVWSADFIGAAGSTARGARGRQISASEITFETTAPLAPNEGLTVAVAFDKGAVAPPSGTDNARYLLRDNAGAVAPAGVLALLAYFIVARLAFARWPRHGVIIPLFKPPANMPPGAVRYVRNMGYDRKVYAASLVDMAVKGYLAIAEDDSGYTLRRTGKSADETALADCEAAIAKPLFASRKRIRLDQENQAAIGKSVSALKTSLAQTYRRGYFVVRVGWFTGGVLFFIAIAAAAVALDAFGSVSIGALVFGGIVVAVFYRLLKSPTPAGRKAIDQIEGFRMFLATAEKDRLEALNPPNVTPEVFDRYLPYAIALDCETAWSRKFELEAAAAATPPDKAGGFGDSAYSPGWYSSGSSSVSDIGAFARGLGASLAASAASAASPPDSDSSSGGGGFSGGGGGGGGGGGW